LAQEAAKIAERVLRICIRALDYCPPVDLTFGEYLRALITADYDVVPNDKHGYRVAFVSAFRAFGIFPREVSTLSLDALLWRGIEDGDLSKAFERLSFSWDRDDDRLKIYSDQQATAKNLYKQLLGQKTPHRLDVLGLAEPSSEFRAWRKTTIDGEAGWVSPIEVHSIRPAHRVTPDQEVQSDLVIELTQKWGPGAERTKGDPFFRGGATVICNAEGKVRYVVRKRLGSRWRIEQQQQDVAELHRLNLWDTYAHSERIAEPFALLHQLNEPR
jgi:hypothetical protein